VGRPPLPLGTFGRVGFVTLSSGAIQARAKYRDYDGRVRLVSRSAPSRAAAERALKIEFTARMSPSTGAVVNGSSHLTALADAWLSASHGWSTGTERTYRSVIHSVVAPALGDLRIQEISPGVVSRALAAIAARHGTSAAKSARACLSGMFRMAIQDGAVLTNPVRDADVRISVDHKSPRALTPDETRRLTDRLCADSRAVELDLPDIVDWMLATGCRIGEALAARYGTNADDQPLLDLDAGTWEVNATIVRVIGKGLVVQPRPKTAAGWRVLALPDYAIQVVRRRGERLGLGPHGTVFPSVLARSLRDPTNTAGDLRRVLDGLDCETCAGTGFHLESDDPGLIGPRRRVRCSAGPWSWVTSHTFRKTVATRLEEAGFTPRQVADQLGHANPSMTLDVYFGRQVVNAAAAKVLER
jgi:integrase